MDNETTEFPKRKIHKEASYRGGTPIEDPTVVDPSQVANFFYDSYDVNDWFKRCLDDLPYGTYKLETFNTKVIQWVEKWFSQFKDSSPSDDVV